MSVIKIKIPTEVLKFFKETGNLTTINYETHVYMAYPWFKAEAGSDEIEVYWNENDYPEDLKRSLEDGKNDN